MNMRPAQCLALAVVAAAVAGCAAGPSLPRLPEFGPQDVIASGRPPLTFTVNRPGSVKVFDLTTGSLIYSADVDPRMDDQFLFVRLDAATRTMVRINPNTTQPMGDDSVNAPMMPIVAEHAYVVTFKPFDVPTTAGPTTRPLATP